MRLLRKMMTLVLRTRRDVRNALLLLVLMVIAALLEALGVGLIMPFVALIQNPRVADVSRPVKLFRALVGIQSDAGLVYAFGIGLMVLFGVKNLYLSFVQWLQFRFIFGRRIALARDLVERYLANDYTFHLRHNSAELIHSVVAEIALVTNHVLVSLFVVAVELLTVWVVLSAMVLVEPVLVPAIGIGSGLIAFGFYRLVHRRSLALGVEEKESQAEMIKWLQQGLGGIKEARVIGVERFFLGGFSRSAISLGRAEGQHRLITSLPRFVLETLGVVALVAVSLGMLARGRGGQAVLPVLGLLAIAAVRLLPSVARVLAAVTDIRHNTPAVDAIFAVISDRGPGVLPPRAEAPLDFKRELRLTNVEYRYPTATAPSLRRISLSIRRGESIAFVGPSGAGKTTIVDLLIGLLEPTSGRLEVDGVPLVGEHLRAWRRGVGYIPQNVYLCDDSILRNVAFGVDDKDIDRARVESAIDAARLRELVESLPEGLNTFVGERGVRLSGGQRQRIGIARALYLEPEVLVLDEATSALDGKTEHEIVEAIERIRSERTAIIVAHRLSTVRGCDRLVFLKDGEVLQVGSWDELYAGNPEFRQLVRLAEADLAPNGLRTSA